MNRTLQVERVYSLGNYQTLRLADSVDNIPEELMLNNDFVDTMRKLQFVNIELMYRKYLVLAEKLSAFNNEEAIAFLLETRENLLDKLNQGEN